MSRRENDDLWLHTDEISSLQSALHTMHLFLFRSIKKKLKETAFGDEQELSLVIRSTMTAIPGDLSLSVFLSR
jgi:hypothetical protein